MWLQTECSSSKSSRGLQLLHAAAVILVHWTAQQTRKQLHDWHNVKQLGCAEQATKKVKVLDA
jgi:hypothetical protein